MEARCKMRENERKRRRTQVKTSVKWEGDGCWAREGEERKKERGRETNYTTDRIARLRECVLSEVNTEGERKTENGKDTRCVK